MQGVGCPPARLLCTQLLHGPARGAGQPAPLAEHVGKAGPAQPRPQLWEGGRACLQQSCTWVRSLGTRLLENPPIAQLPGRCKSDMSGAFLSAI